MSQSVKAPEVATALNNLNSTPEVKYGEFGGKYVLASLEVYDFLVKQYGMEPAKAHKIGHMFACDYGAAMKQSGISENKAKTGKATEKTGMVTLRDTTTTIAKGVYQTYPLAISHAIQWLNDAGKHGISYGNTNWEFTTAIVKWIEELSAD